MDTGEDMNATPMSVLDKMPPPLLQSKAAQGPVELPNYRDLLNEMEQSNPTGGAGMGSPPPPRSSHMPLLEQQSPQHMPQQMMQQMPQQMPQHMPQQMPQQTYAPQQMYYPPQQQQYVTPYQTARPRAPPRAPPPPKSNLVVRVLRNNKAVVAVVVIVFVLLAFVLPRLLRMPRFATPEGRLKILGTLAASISCGGVFKLAMALSP